MAIIQNRMIERSDMTGGVVCVDSSNKSSRIQFKLLRAQLQIGYQYNYGEGVPASATEAVRWYAKAAAQNDATAQANLGDMYK